MKLFDGFNLDLSRCQHCQVVAYTPCITRCAKQAADAPCSDMVEEIP